MVRFLLFLEISEVISSPPLPLEPSDISLLTKNFHPPLQNFEHISKIAEIWNQETEDFIRNAWLSSL